MAEAAANSAGKWPGTARPHGRGLAGAGWAVSAGVLWLLYGWFEMSSPFGVDAVYDARRDYEVVVDRSLFALYSLPGAGALGAAAMTLLRITSASSGARGAWAHALARTALVCALLGATGVAVGLVPLFFAPQAFGTPILGTAAWLTAGLGQDETRKLLLRCLGVAGIVSLGLWPAVWALGVLSPAAGIALIAAYGAGWAALAPVAADATRTMPSPVSRASATS